jgi:hypothetical protein
MRERGQLSHPPDRFALPKNQVGTPRSPECGSSFAVVRPGRLIVPFPQSPKRTCLASMFAVSENSERADVRNATSRNDWRCLNGWSELLNELMDSWT